MQSAIVLASIVLFFSSGGIAIGAVILSAGAGGGMECFEEPQSINQETKAMKRVVLYIDHDGQHTILADEEGTELIWIDERAPQRIMRNFARVGSEAIIEALLSEPQERSQTATGEEKKRPTLRLIEGNGG